MRPRLSVVLKNESAPIISEHGRVRAALYLAAIAQIEALEILLLQLALDRSTPNETIKVINGVRRKI